MYAISFMDPRTLRNRFNFGAQRYILCTSELSLLTVLVPARDLRPVKERLITAIDEVLVDLEVPAVRREREFREMDEFGVAKTNSLRTSHPGGL
jgi:hypothetical protein